MTEHSAPHARRSLRDLAPEAAIEGLTMALYVSLSLIAVLVALPPATADEPADELAWLVLLTSLGLVLAHLLAFRLSSRMVHGSSLPPESVEVIAAQIIGGLAVTILAIAPILVFGADAGGTVAKYVLLGIVTLAGWIVATRAGLTRMRRLGYVLLVIALVQVVLSVKAIAGH